MLQEFHLVFLTAELIFRSGTARAAEEQQVVNGEITFGQDAEKLLTHGAAGTNDGYFHTFSL